MISARAITTIPSTHALHIDTIPQVNETTFMLTNGLISRTFTTAPDFGTINFYSYTLDESLFRAIYPEAIVTIDGRDADCLLMIAA